MTDRTALMRCMVIGDIIGKPGRLAVVGGLRDMRAELDLDLVIANGENLAAGAGLTPSLAEELFANGIDVITSGNHIWDKREGLPLVRDDARILRPGNYPPGTEGRGWGVFRGRSGTPYAVVSLAGRVFMGHPDCPFRWMDSFLPEMKRSAAAVLVDFHAEATSEKRAMAFHLDGNVSALAGTHTHVQTSDAQVLPRGTGYITDAGMCGPVHSVIGMNPEDVLRRFLLQLPTRFEVAAGEAEASGVFFDVDPDAGACRAVQSFRMTESEMRSGGEAWKRF